MKKRKLSDIKIGERIRIARKLKGLTLKEMGEKLNVHWSTVQGWEKGKGIPSTKINKICKVLEILPSRLFEDKSETIQYSYLSEISAGTPIFASENIKRIINIKEILPKDPNLLLLKVIGDSMIGEGIYPGDYVLIEPSINNINEKGIYAVAIFSHGCEHAEALLKKIRKTDNKIILCSCNFKYYPEIYHQSEIQIIGKVVRVIRKL